MPEEFTFKIILLEFTEPKNVAVEAEADAVPKLNSFCPVPVGVKLITVAVLAVLPIFNAVAAPAILTVVAVSFTTENVVCVVVSAVPAKAAPSAKRTLLLPSKKNWVSNEAPIPVIDVVFVYRGYNIPAVA